MSSAAAVVALALSVLLAPASEARRGKRKAAPTGVAHLAQRAPVDPLLYVASDVDELRRSVAALLSLAERLADGELDRDELAAQLAAFEERIGCSLVDELVPAVGPALALTLDLPPFDELPLAFAEPDSGLPRALGGIGLLVEVRDAPTLDGCVRGVLALAGGELVEDAGLTRAAVGPEGGPPLDVWYAIRDGLMALGLSRGFVEDSLAGRPAGQRLVDGEDHAALFAHLDPAPVGATYVNLPKLAGRLRGSALVQGALAGDEAAAPVLELLDDDALFAVGIGSTTARLGDDGISRTSSAGSSLLTGGNAATIGVVAAIAIPNLLNAIDRGKQQRTMIDLRSIATALEAYANDHDGYPVTDGWRPVSTLEDELTPRYIRSLPTVDGWGNRIVVTSDGASYRLVSPGKDGLVDADWSREFESGATSRFDADLVFGDGSFLRWPEGRQE